MAFPENRLSTRAIPSQLVGAKAQLLPPRTFSTEEGPIAEQDPSKGMQYQIWTAAIEADVVWLEAEEVARRTLIPNPNGTVKDIAIAFNQNADLHYAWTDDGVLYFHHYDTLTSQMQTMTLPAGSITPKLTMDDKRSTQNADNDIILTYKRAGKLWCRLQRDRFLIERDPTLDVPEPERTAYRTAIAEAGGIVRFGMSRQWRLQWMLDTDPNGPY